MTYVSDDAGTWSYRTRDSCLNLKNVVCVTL